MSAARGRPVQDAKTDEPRLGIYAISPSGAVIDDDRIARAPLNLARAGFDLTLDRAALRRTQRFAGPDTVRAAMRGPRRRR